MSGVLLCLEYNPLLYVILALLESPSSLALSKPERIPNLASESVSLLLLLREESAHGRS